MKSNHQKNKVHFAGNNKDFAKFNVVIDFECSIEDPHKVIGTGKYSDLMREFQLEIKAVGACRKDIPLHQVIIHKYRLFYFFTFLVLGLYCTLFGMKNVNLSLKLIGFATGFWLIFTVMAIILHSCRLIRHAYSSVTGCPGRGCGGRLSGGQGHVNHGVLPQLRLQLTNQWCLRLSLTCSSSL